MSSARANAAARSRRAGGADFSASQQNNNRPGQQQQQPAAPARVKLSISDAIALITLRLGRVENIVQVLHNESGSSVGADGNLSVDETVFNNIVDRIESLESNPQGDSLSKDNEIADLKQTITSQQSELAEIKAALSKLQMFTMETNQKLISAVFQNGASETQTMETNRDIINENVEEEVAEPKTSTSMPTFTFVPQNI